MISASGPAGGAQFLRGARNQRKPRAALSESRRASRADAFGSSRDEDHFSVDAHFRRLPGTGLRRNNGSMSTRLLPLFPLHVVVFPRTHLPLHIFEERYKEMVGNALRDNSEFGIVLAKDDGIVNAGCTVIVEKVLKKYPDGKMDILACGRRRFEVVMLDEEKDYLRGEVQFFDDDDQDAPAPLEAQHAALTQYKKPVGIGRSASAHPRAEPGRSAAQLSTGTGTAGSGFSERAVAHAVGSAAAAGVERVPVAIRPAATAHRSACARSRRAMDSAASRPASEKHVRHDPGRRPSRFHCSPTD